MSEYLFIRPGPGNPGDCEWFSYDEQTRNVLSAGRVRSLRELGEIRRVAPDRPVALLYPAASVKFRKIEFPGKLKRSAVRSLLYVIEDEFAGDADDFAVRVLEKQGREYSVAIYREDELRKLEKALILLGFDVEIIVPDVFALPFPGKNEPEVAGYALRLGSSWLVRDGKNSGMELPEEWLAMLAEPREDGTRAKYVSLSPLPEELKEAWEEDPVESPLAFLAEGALKCRLNLSSKRKKRNYHIKFMLVWVKVAVLIALATGLWLVNYSARIRTVRQETLDYRNQQRILFNQVAGVQGQTTDPVARMKELIENSSPIGTDEGFVDLSKLLFPYLTAQKDIEVVSLKFDRGRKQFTVQFLAKPDFGVDAFLSGLSPDFSGRLEGAKPSREKLLNTVQIRRTGQ